MHERVYSVTMPPPKPVGGRGGTSFVSFSFPLIKREMRSFVRKADLRFRKSQRAAEPIGGLNESEAIGFFRAKRFSE